MSINGQRILVVDDERVIADTLALIFRNAGYDAKAVYEGREAVECARAFAPHVVISDVMMPGVNGVEAAMTIERECLGTKVLLMSGQARSAALLDRALLAGFAFPLVLKPIPPDELLEKVAEMLAESGSAANA